jgi:hypothetical protein
MRYRVGLGIVLLAACVRAEAAPLQVVPHGADFQVNTSVEANQDYAAVACASLGSCTVAWHSDGAMPTNYGIFAQRYESTGAPLGSELHLSSDNLDEPAITASNSGGFLLSWSAQLGTAEWLVAIQAYDNSAAPLQVASAASSTSSETQSDQSLACNTQGDCVVVWDEESTAVWARTYTAAGGARGAQTKVTSLSEAPVSFPHVAVASTGGFLVAWHVFATDVTQSTVMARLYDANGVPAGVPFAIAPTENQFTDPAGLGVAVDAAGTFVVVWDSQLNADFSLNFRPRPGEIYAQRIDSTGARLGAPILVASIDSTLWQFDATVSADPTGDFLVVWQDQQITGNRERIMGRLYDGNGTAQGDALQINGTSTGRHRAPAVASDAGGNRLVAWESTDMTPNGVVSRGVWARRLTVLGAAMPTPTATVTPPAQGSSNSEGCAIVAPRRSSPMLWLVSIPLIIGLMRRW